jgi:hypothetical protein
LNYRDGEDYEKDTTNRSHPAITRAHGIHSTYIQTKNAIPRAIFSFIKMPTFLLFATLLPHYLDKILLQKDKVLLKIISKEYNAVEKYSFCYWTYGDIWFVRMW